MNFSLPWLIGCLLGVPGCINNSLKLIKVFKKQETLGLITVIQFISYVGLISFSAWGFVQTQSDLKKLRTEVKTKQTELSKLRAQTIFLSWGGTSATVDTSILSEYKNTHNVMLIFRSEVRSVDYLTDRMISKSYLFPIDGERSVEVSKNELLGRPNATGMIHVFLAILPKTVSADRISCLADIDANQGQIIAKRGSRFELILQIKKE